MKEKNLDFYTKHTFAKVIIQLFLSISWKLNSKYTQTHTETKYKEIRNTYDPLNNMKLPLRLSLNVNPPPFSTDVTAMLGLVFTIHGFSFVVLLLIIYVSLNNVLLIFLTFI